MSGREYYSIISYKGSRAVYSYGMFLGYIALDKCKDGWTAGILNPKIKNIFIDNEPKSNYKEAIKSAVDFTLRQPYFRKKLERKMN